MLGRFVTLPAVKIHTGELTLDLSDAALVRRQEPQRGHLK